LVIQFHHLLVFCMSSFAPRAFNLQKRRTQMQTLTRMNMVQIEDYYHMTTLNENVNRMKLIHLLSKNSLDFKAPFCTSTFGLKSLIDFLNVHSREK